MEGVESPNGSRVHDFDHGLMEGEGHEITSHAGTNSTFFLISPNVWMRATETATKYNQSGHCC